MIPLGTVPTPKRDLAVKCDSNLYLGYIRVGLDFEDANWKGPNYYDSYSQQYCLPYCANLKKYSFSTDFESFNEKYKPIRWDVLKTYKEKDPKCVVEVHYLNNKFIKNPGSNKKYIKIKTLFTDTVLNRFPIVTKIYSNKNVAVDNAFETIDKWLKIKK